MRNRARFIFLTLIAGAAIGVAGCSSGGGGKSSTPKAPPAAVRTDTPVPPAAATAVAQGSNPTYQPYTDPNGRFTASIPQGWTMSERADTLELVLPGTPVTAVLDIACEPNGDVDTMLSRDASDVSKFNSGKLDPSTATPVQVAGVSGKYIEWTGGVLGSSVQVDHLEAYFVGKGCGWRAHLAVYPGPDPQQMKQVLDHVLGSFKFT